MKVLVTGATGFIGNYVVEELLKQPHSVVASSTDLQRAKNATWFDRVNYIPLDLATMDPTVNYFKFFDRPDAMIHLAWEGLPNYKSSFHEEINLPRHSQFLKNLVQNGLTDLTVTGTCFEYGMQEGRLTENLPASPINSYGKAKDALRQQLEELGRAHPFGLKWVRLFYMYGKGQNPNSLLSQLDKALANGESTFNMSGGEQERDFLPVEKVAEYIIKIALQNKVAGIINVSSGKPVTVREFVTQYLKKIGRHISLNTGYYPYPDYEPMGFWGDNARLKTILSNE